MMSLGQVNFWYWVVDRLPKKLVYFCFLRVWHHATHGEYKNVNGKISCGAAVTRYETDYNILGE